MQALHQAVHLGTKEITHMLVDEMNADVNSRMANELTALHCASQTYAGAMGIILLRAQYNLDENANDRRNASPLHFAVLFKQCKNVELLIKYGADVNHQDFQG